MSKNLPRHSARMIMLLVWLNLLCAVFAAGTEPERVETSLPLIPSDTEYYAAYFRNREQTQAIVQSNAWKKLESVPLFVAAKAYLRLQLKQHRPIELLPELLADEVFICGGEGYSEFHRLGIDVYSQVRYGPTFIRFFAPELELNATEQRVFMLLQSLSANVQRIKAPNVVVGFKLKSPQRAKTVAAELGKWFKEALPEASGVATDGPRGDGAQFTLAMDGTMLPWEHLDLERYEIVPGEYDALVERMRNTKLQVVFRLHGNYLLLVVGSQDGVWPPASKRRLVDRPELKPLEAFADRRLTSIAFASRRLKEQELVNDREVDESLDFLLDLLTPIETSEEQRRRIRDDLGRIGDDLKTWLSRPGPTLSFTFWTDRGLESYTYDHCVRRMKRPAGEMTILQHVGESPIFAIAGQTGELAAAYGKLLGWAEIARGYFEEFAVPDLFLNRGEYDRAVRDIDPLLHRLNEVTKRQFLPALSGEAAMILDSHLSSQQWLGDSFRTDKPFRILEPAIALSINDPKAMKTAMVEYRELVNNLLRELREITGPGVLNLRIPRPTVRNEAEKTVYSYPVADQLGVDESIAPTIGVSPRVVAGGLSVQHVNRLLAARPIRNAGPVLAGIRQRKCSTIVYLDFAELMDVLSPWIELGTRSIAPIYAPSIGSRELDEMVTQLQTAMEVSTVFRRFSSCTFLQNQVWVTHSELEIRDLPSP